MRRRRGRGGGRGSLLKLNFASPFDQTADEDFGGAADNGYDAWGYGLGEGLVGDLLDVVS